MRAILSDTLSEFFSRKVIYLFAFVTLILLLGVWLTGGIEQDFSRSMGEDFRVEDVIGPLAPWIATAFSQIMNVLIFLAVLATVGLIPKALEKGRAEFYLARPISRPGFLLSKLFSIWIVYGAVAIVCGLITYVAVAVTHDSFQMGIFLLLAVYLLIFFIWLSVAVIGGILTRSTVWAMTSVFIIWIAQSLLSLHDSVNQLISSRVLVNVIDTLYYIVPKIGELRDLAVDLAVGGNIQSWLPLWSSTLFAAVLVYAAVTVFKRSNY